MLSAIHTVTVWLNEVGYLAVYLVLFVESIGVPSPSEIILLFSGYEVWLGHFSYPIVVLVAAAGSTTGATGAYFIARLGGRPLLLKHFRWIFRTPERLAYWENYFHTKGDKVVLIGRVISGVRMIISYPAGIFEMPYPRFLLFTIIGSILWPLIAVTAGWLLGPHVVSGLEAVKQYEAPVAIGIVLLLALWWWWDRQKKKRQVLPMADDPPVKSTSSKKPTP
ncbi:MAG: DedA family protein [Sulfobacillus thermosulfidooxidans]|nr:MAG: DedA family protein [Sulfobacillus thermosulfidooxidans]